MLAVVSGNVAAVRLCVSDLPGARNWYARFLERAPVENGPDYIAFDLGALRLEIVRADDKNPVSTGGTIVYWQVANLQRAIEHALACGARLYRGPLDLPEVSLAQVVDPQGLVIGLSHAPG